MEKHHPTNWRITFIDPVKVEANPFFTRADLDATLDQSFIESATEDLKQPVIVRPKPKAEGRYQLAFGHRRWAAFRSRGIDLPAVVRTLSDEEMVDYAWDDTFQFEAHEPEDEARLILKRLDFKLKHMPEYAAFGDPIKLLNAMENQRIQGIRTPRGVEITAKDPRGRKQKHPPVPESLVKCVEGVFAELPAKRQMDWSTFYRHRLPLLSIPEKIRKQLDEKEVLGSARAKEAIARVEDNLARKMMAEWAASKEKISVRVLDKRTRVFNKCASDFARIANHEDKERIVRLVLEKCPHPKDVKLEIEKVAPPPPQERLGGRTQSNQSPGSIMEGIYIGRDSADMAEIASESVRLIITSPPYFNKVEFEDYLSRCKTPDEYFKKVEPIVRECFRVLMPAGKLCINWGEPIGECNGADYEEYIFAGRWAELCESVGLRLWGRITWWKDPPSYAFARDRVRWSDAVRTDGKVHLNSEQILVFRKPGPMPEGNNKITHEEFVEISNSVWRIPAAREGPRGLAIFPEELVERLVKYYSFPGDTVLDPFLGTGVTVKVAKRLGRRGVGYEIAKWLEPIIRETVGDSESKRQ